MKKSVFSFLTAGTLLLAVACGDSSSSEEITKDTMASATNFEGVPNTEASSTAPSDAKVGESTMVSGSNIVQNASNSTDHSTFVAALKSAGLVETLSGAGPYTVFAPTNQAFSGLPAGTIDRLMKPDQKKKLIELLNYHVVAGALKAADLKDGQMLKTVQGNEVKVSSRNGIVSINNLRVTSPDNISSNGIIHVIDGVLTPGK